MHPPSRRAYAAKVDGWWSDDESYAAILIIAVGAMCTRFDPLTASTSFQSWASIGSTFLRHSNHRILLIDAFIPMQETQGNVSP